MNFLFFLIFALCFNFLKTKSIFLIENNSTIYNINERFFHSESPSLSYQMKPHNFSYKPKRFDLSIKKINHRKILVEFNYSYPHPYVNYIIRMRYHGYKNEFMSKQIRLEVTNPNRVLLRNFPNAAYILCITLIPSMTVSIQQYPFLSTSDMCGDLIFGEDIIVNYHQNKPGYLVPSLAILVLIILSVITIVNKLITSNCCRSKEFAQKQKEKNLALKKNALNSVVSLNNLLNFNQDFADMSHLVKMLVYQGDERVYAINSNDSSNSIISLNTKFNRNYFQRKNS